jgi:hypothetical protein
MRTWSRISKAACDACWTMRPALRTRLPDLPRNPAQRAHAQFRAGAPAHRPRRARPMATLCALARAVAGRAGRRPDRLQELIRCGCRAPSSSSPCCSTWRALQAEVAALPAEAWVAHPDGVTRQQRGAADQRRRRRNGFRPRADAADALARGHALPAPGVGRLRRGLEPLAADAPSARRDRARACRHQLPLAQAGAAAHSGLHLAGGALPLRRAIGAHGRGRGLDLRQLAPAPCGERLPPSASIWSPTPPARLRSGSSPVVRRRRASSGGPWAGSPRLKPQLLCEGDQRSPMMPAAEVQWLVDDLRAKSLALQPTPPKPGRAPRGSACCWRASCFDWRQLCALHGAAGGVGRVPAPGGAVREAARPLTDGLVMRTNGAGALLVLEKRVLQHLVQAGGGSRSGPAIHRS